MKPGDGALRGDMGSVAVAGGEFGRVDELEEGMRFLRAGIDGVRAAGEGRALSALIEACRPVEQRVRTIAAVRIRAGQAITTYANEVASLQDEARRIRARTAEAAARRGATAQQRRAVDPVDADAAQRARRLDADLDQADAELAALERALTELDHARLRLDRRCAAEIDACTATLDRMETPWPVPGAGPVRPASLASLLANAVSMVDAAGLDALLSRGLSPDQLALAWGERGLTRTDIRRLPIETLFRLANADGIPYWARDVASREALTFAEAEPAKAYTLLGFADQGLSTDALKAAARELANPFTANTALRPHDLTLEEFTAQVKALARSLWATEVDASRLPGRPTVQLVGFGNHDGAITAAIAIGDVDNAKHVGINVPGMGSNVANMDGALLGAASLFREGTKRGGASDVAVLTWLGYRAPKLFPLELGVAFGDRARAGGDRLAAHVNGIYGARGGPPPAVAVFAHSYGSTVAVEGLKSTTSRVDALAVYGSAGVEPGTALAHIRADRVYATSARGDGVAGYGISISRRTDPRDLDGVTVFSSEGVDGKKEVTVHDMYTETDRPGLLNWQGKTGYLSDETNSVAFMGQLLAGMVR